MKETQLEKDINQMPETLPAKGPRGRPKLGDRPMTTLQRVRKHRWRQEQKNEAHMRELIAIIKSSQEQPCLDTK